MKLGKTQAYEDLSIAPSLELKHCGRGFFIITLITINRTIFGIETCVEVVPPPTFGSINRTIFGIETRWGRYLWLFAWSYQSHHLWNWNFVSFNGAGVCCNFYQSHHLWNWNVEGNDRRIIAWRLSIAPSLELKFPRWAPASAGRGLSIAPSLELKSGFRWSRRILKTLYQSHHLWNWNLIEVCTWNTRLHYQSHHLWNWNPILINDGRLNISTYQSHHLWNWNERGADNRYWPVQPINRTIFGIEIFYLWFLMKKGWITINRTIFGIEIRAG